MTFTPDQAVNAATARASMERDPERWTDSYRNHTASALRRRALAAGNGHAAREDVTPARERGN